MNTERTLTTASYNTPSNTEYLLKELEAEAIEILREAVSEARNPVMLYSVGKDSSVLLALAVAAFAPGSVPFPLLHIDTTWKFRQMIEFRDETVRALGMDLIVHMNSEALQKGVNPFDYGSSYTDIMKTQALREALDRHNFDVVIGGARRDEEKSRAKERIFSVRGAGHSWNPKEQRPEFWNNYNVQLGSGQSLRVFPLSNWTELDIWRYIESRQVPVVDLYLARERPVVQRESGWIMVDDDRMRLDPDEIIQMRRIRFRTLGCYPLTAGIESEAATVEEVVEEISSTLNSERMGRLIDHDDPSSMERRKLEGYF